MQFIIGMSFGISIFLILVAAIVIGTVLWVKKKDSFEKKIDTSIPLRQLPTESRHMKIRRTSRTQSQGGQIVVNQTEEHPDNNRGHSDEVVQTMNRSEGRMSRQDNISRHKYDELYHNYRIPQGIERPRKISSFIEDPHVQY
ncbi:unnamed protein product [Lymnaea stagnalis]|uniref:Uncharacterized protein n=1 Tax=Lymnaea stagnalis TaxID=6523 RepID=A0AAV2I5E3_LYMST